MYCFLKLKFELLIAIICITIHKLATKNILIQKRLDNSLIMLIFIDMTDLRNKKWLFQVAQIYGTHYSVVNKPDKNTVKS